MDQETKSIEKEAHRLLEEHKYQEAADLFYRLAKSYQKFEKHHPAAMCLASAASCWAMKAGEHTLYQAARDYEKAAQEAEKTGDLEYTALLYKHAAVCYEKDKEHAEFAECYLRSKEFLCRSLGQNIRHSLGSGNLKECFSRDFFQRFMHWLALSFSSILWGYGEKPQRTVIFGVSFIILCATLYAQGYLYDHGERIRPDFAQALYFSVVTFTTVGYGDITPDGFSRFIAVWEAYSGLFLVSIFITGLCRKYLRE